MKNILRAVPERGLQIIGTVARRMCAAALLLGIALATAPALAQSDKVQQAYLVGDLDSSMLVLTVPKDWKVDAKRWPLLIEMGPGSNEEFKFLITVFGVPKERRNLLLPENLQAAARRASENAKVHSVETEFPLTELANGNGKGYFYSVTDKDLAGKPAEPGNYKHMRQGIMAIGDLYLVVTVLANEPEAPSFGLAMSALAGARQLKGVPYVSEASKQNDFLERIQVSAASIGPDVKPDSNLYCANPQPMTLYEGSILGQLGAPLKSKRHQSFTTGAGQKGSVLYLEFEKPVTESTSGFIGGLLWGEDHPSPMHQEEYFIHGKYLVVWCTPMLSPIKTASQRKLTEVIVP